MNKKHQTRDESGPHRGDRLATIMRRAGLDSLPARERSFIYRQARQFRFTLQELRQIGEIAMDLTCWPGESLMEAWPGRPPSGYQGKQARSWLLQPREWERPR